MNNRFVAAAVLFLVAISTSQLLLRAGPQPHPPQEPPSAESRSVWDGVYTEEQSKRGEELYRKQCASCHGEMLTGGESAPPLSGGAFLSNWNGLTVGDLFDRIRKTMPLNAPGKLTRQQNADILAFVFSVNKFPCGKSELQNKTEFLKEIRLEMTKPKEAGKSRASSMAFACESCGEGRARIPRPRCRPYSTTWRCPRR